VNGIRGLLAGAAALAALALSGGCLRAGSGRPAVTAGPLALVWSADGAALLVGDRWRFEPSSGRFVPLAGRGGERRPVPSLDGRAVFWLGRGSYRLERVGAQPAAAPPASSAASAPIPRFLPDDPQSAFPDLDLRQAAFWLDAGRVYLSQQSLGLGLACRVLDVVTGVWSEPPGGCVRGDGFPISAFTPGSGGRLAVLAEIEGHPELRLLRYDPAAGEAPLPAPRFDLYPAGPAAASFGPGERIDFASPCDLARTAPPPCAGAEGAPWRVWTWTPAGGRALRQAFGPAGPAAGGFVWSAASGRAAWLAGGRLCIGPGPAAARCAALPAGLEVEP
jgi:hypothetical protein